jgi:hypothetical protein
MIYRIQYVVCFLSLVCIAAFSSKPVGNTETHGLLIKAFSLSDQYGDAHQQTFPKSKVSIYALADRKGSKKLEDWITPFYKRFEDRVDICGVANLRGVPDFMKPVIRKLFRRGVNYPVMLDWSGEICKSFGYKAGMPDIFIITRGGQLRYRTSGTASTEKLNACFAVLDQLLTEEKGTGETSASPEGELTL